MKVSAGELEFYSFIAQVFAPKPVPCCIGVYISKASYAREGEKSLDNFYRPWHLVEYYRYMRFFSNGTMLFLTTPDEPKQIVARLKKSSPAGHNVMPQSGTINTNDSILKGNWTVNDNKVNISLLRKVYKKPENRTRRQANKEAILEQEHVFRIVSPAHVPFSKMIDFAAVPQPYRNRLRARIAAKNVQDTVSIRPWLRYGTGPYRR